MDADRGNFLAPIDTCGGLGRRGAVWTRDHGRVRLAGMRRTPAVVRRLSSAVRPTALAAGALAAGALGAGTLAAGTLATAALAAATLAADGEPAGAATDPTAAELRPGPATAAAAPARPAAGNRLTLGHSARLADDVGAALAATVLRRRLGYRVETLLADPPFLYSALAGGRIDLLPGAWTPTLHRRFLERLPAGVVRLGVLYRGARVGWLVPADAPAESLADLADPRLRRAFGATVQAGEAGSGAVRLSRRALEIYGLNGWRLATSSPAGASLALTRALARGELAVATGRRPHWLPGTRPVRFLADPARAFGGPQTVRVLGRAGLRRDHPWAAEVLGRIRLELAEMQALVARAHRDGVAAAVQAWLARHASRVDRWSARPGAAAGGAEAGGPAAGSGN